MKRLLTSFFLLLIISSPIRAQAPVSPTSAEILLSIKKLNFLGNVLYLAAHPDDENTWVIAYLSKGRYADVAYLSLNRGSGGQNLIGPEIRERLGLIRTQELLAARSIDGGSQFFSRANDFGYSKLPSETFNIWDREKVLADVIWTIRQFRPDVIITRFNTTPGISHGHHTASAILAGEAFNKAADTACFPDQLDYVEPWQAKRIVWNTSPFFYDDKEKFDSTARANDYLGVEIGGYNALLGKSYGELSAESRSMHRSQGFGVFQARRNNYREYFSPTDGVVAEADLFDDVNTTWTRVEGGKPIGDKLEEIINNYDPVHPDNAVPALLELRKMITSLEDGYWKSKKLKELDEVIRHSLGLFLEVTASDFSVVPGDSMTFNVEAVNRTDVPVTLNRISYSSVNKDNTLDSALNRGEPVIFSSEVKIPADLPVSQPYWLKEPGTKGMYVVEDLHMRNLPENPPAVEATFEVEISGQRVTYTVPVVYKKALPDKGETYRPFVIIPPVAVNINEKVYIFPDKEPREVRITVRAGKDDITGEVALNLAEGWRSEPARENFDFELKDENQTFSFMVYPPDGQSQITLGATATVNGIGHNRSLEYIAYDHIPTQTYMPVLKAELVKINIEKKGQRIGYIMGAGDGVPTALQQIGYEVELLEADDLEAANLARYDAVILGVRAYNTQNFLKVKNDELLKYTKNGGTLITQYNTTRGLLTDDFAPYNLQLSRKRVTVEEAPVEILAPKHPVMNEPNPITQADFKGWVQERGLYFPEEWDDEYTPILSSHDPDEEPLKGGLLVAEYGEGYYIYTGYSWFRELPAGVPGAYRIFANLISIGK